MTSYRLGETLHARFETADVVPYLRALLAVALRERDDLTDGRYLLPVFEERPQFFGQWRLIVVTLFDPAMSFFLGLSTAANAVLEVVLVQLLDDRCVQLLLVPFDGQHIIATALDNLASDLFLAAHPSAPAITASTANARMSVNS